MDLDFVFIVNYECPGCHVGLEDRSNGLPTWYRCPRCGRASQPPEHQRWDRSTSSLGSRTSPLVTSSEIEFAIAPEAPLPIRPRPMAALPRTSGVGTDNTRVILGIGSFTSLLVFIFSLLSSNTTLAILMAIAFFVCLILLIGPSSRFPRD